MTCYSTVTASMQLQEKTGDLLLRERKVNITRKIKEYVFDLLI